MNRFPLFPIVLITLFLLAMSIPGVFVSAQPAFPARDIPVAASSAMESLDALGVNADGDYLVVWEKDAGGGNTDIWARRAAFVPGFRWLGDAFVIANSAKPERAAAVAYNATDDEFLVTYEYLYSDQDHDVRGQRVTGDASASSPLIGSTLSIGFTTGSERTPDVAFLPATGQYLVVYEMDGDVWARRIARHGQGDDGGEFLGDEFLVAAETGSAETKPAVAAATDDQYFLVTYSYAFSPDDDDVRAQRVRGQTENGEDMLAGHFSVADTADRENAPTIAYSPQARAFIVLWQMVIPFNDDVRGAWVDAGNFTGQPIIGQTFDVAADVLAMESAPAVAVDDQTGETAVALSYATMAGDWRRPAMIWLDADPRASKRVARPLQALPDRSFDALKLRVRLLPGQSRFLIGYTARWGTSSDADHDAYLLAASRWGVFMPLIRR